MTDITDIKEEAIENIEVENEGNPEGLVERLRTNPEFAKDLMAYIRFNATIKSISPLILYARSTKKNVSGFTYTWG